MVHPTGRKTFYFLYRHIGTSKRRLKVGVYGSITCDIAREIVRGWTGDLARGLDPKDQNKKREIEEKHSITMKAFLGIFTEKHKKVHNKESTNNRDGNRLKGIIIPFLGNLRVSEVSSEDILKLQGHLKNSPIQFNRCNAILSKAFSLAEIWGYRAKNSNPCYGIQKYPEKKKERFLTSEELEKLDEVLKLQESMKLSSLSSCYPNVDVHRLPRRGNLNPQMEGCFSRRGISSSEG
jgi:hypothetical protein